MTIIKTYFSETVFYSGLGAKIQLFKVSLVIAEKGSFFQNSQV